MGQAEPVLALPHLPEHKVRFEDHKQRSEGLQDLQGRMIELPSGDLWVHCASGFRASIAASLLDGAGREVVLVDDEWSRAASSGLPIEKPERLALGVRS